MNWVECADRMDQFVIKKDGTAVNNDYFMATHVPFQHLMLTEYGQTDSPDTPVSEEQIYQKLVVNKSDRHQMIIVRGSNGTGKSHLICWLHNRFIADSEAYNPNKEKVIFLRRLGNTVRGAVQQMLDEGLAGEGELREKFERFVHASESQTEEEMKTTIYGEFVNKVLTDNSSSVFKPVKCKDIAAFLSDSRVRNYLMQPTGPVDRCYQMITSGAKTMVTDATETIFKPEDFKMPRDVKRDIKNNAAEEVRSFYIDELNDDEALIRKLVDYLNHFTSSVIQRCANITSENARDLFVHLRQSLFKEGKKLTLFIEDFTSFSIVESELITALSVENGGAYSDLCRVTSIIGITDGYYGSFRDNFKDRVTAQISVTQEAYSDERFILEMSARYLNAIYCRPESVSAWYNSYHSNTELPRSEFTPNYEWESFRIGDSDYTLYPFTKQSLIRLRDHMTKLTPRYFLSYVIQHFFHEFADGMQYQSDWSFPSFPSQMVQTSLMPPYSNTVDNSDFSATDKNRMKVLFSIWGDETTEADDGAIGGVPCAFLNDIGLGTFRGVAKVKDAQDSAQKKKEMPSQQTAMPKETAVQSPSNPVQAQDPEYIKLTRHLQDIAAWRDQNAKLEYGTDYNRWLKSFIGQTIAWQDMGYPAELAQDILNKSNAIYIEDIKKDLDPEKAFVNLPRNSETYTILIGLSNFAYRKSWDFKDGEYYQMVLINWLEDNRDSILKKMFDDSVGQAEHPLVTWGMAEEYLRRILKGEDLSSRNNLQLLKTLMLETPHPVNTQRKNDVWNDTVTYLLNNDSESGTARKYLGQAGRTYMGIIQEGTAQAGGVAFYRYQDLLLSLQRLRQSGWDIEDKVKAAVKQPYLEVRKPLLEIYKRIKMVLVQEKNTSKEIIKRFEDLIGKNPTEEAYLLVVQEVIAFFQNCNNAHEAIDMQLVDRFHISPDEQAKRALKLYQVLQANVKHVEDISLLESYAKAPNEKLLAIVEDLERVDKLATQMEAKHNHRVTGLYQVDQGKIDEVVNALSDLCDRVEKLEVIQ